MTQISDQQNPFVLKISNVTIFIDSGSPSPRIPQCTLYSMHPFYTKCDILINFGVRIEIRIPLLAKISIDLSAHFSTRYRIRGIFHRRYEGATCPYLLRTARRSTRPRPFRWWRGKWRYRNPRGKPLGWRECVCFLPWTSVKELKWMR